MSTLKLKQNVLQVNIIINVPFYGYSTLPAWKCIPNGKINFIYYYKVLGITSSTLQKYGIL